MGRSRFVVNGRSICKCAWDPSENASLKEFGVCSRGYEHN